MTNNNIKNEENQLYLGSNSDKDMDMGVIETIAIPESNPTALSGNKGTQSTVEKQEPSVRVTYSSLTRESKQKLKELLQQWSQWHAQHISSSNDSSVVLECGEETYFPALHIGLDKASTVTFWMDNTKDNEIKTVDGKSVPFYDRGYSLALASNDNSSNMERSFEELHGSRCFNCGSYSHTLKECPKPHDSVAVNKAIKEHSAGRKQMGSFRNPTRYYQTTPKGKFDGLKPGVLSDETRKALRLGDLDPPPWLNRMREIGYPPGYLDTEEEEDPPSGITIYAEEESKEEEKRVETTNHPKGLKKMSAEFPGMNAPIPNKANRRQWEDVRSPPSLKEARYHPYQRYDRPSETINRVERIYQDIRTHGSSPNPTLVRYSERYPSYPPSRSPYGMGSPSFGGYMRPDTGRTRRDPLTNYDYENVGVYGSLPW